MKIEPQRHRDAEVVEPSSRHNEVSGAIVDAAYASRSRLLLAVLALIILAADIELCFVRVVSPLWLWTAPAWLAFYLFARATTANGVVLPAKASA